MITIEEVRKFLNQFHEKMKIFGIYEVMSYHSMLSTSFFNTFCLICTFWYKSGNLY